MALGGILVDCSIRVLDSELESHSHFSQWHNSSVSRLRGVRAQARPSIETARLTVPLSEIPPKKRTSDLLLANSLALKQRKQPVDRRFPVEPLGVFFPPGLGHRFITCKVIKKPVDTFGIRLRAGGKRKPDSVHSLPDVRRNATCIGCYDRQSERAGFAKNDGGTFRARGKNEEMALLNKSASRVRPSCVCLLMKPTSLRNAGFSPGTRQPATMSWVLSPCSLRSRAVCTAISPPLRFQSAPRNRSLQEWRSRLEMAA